MTLNELQRIKRWHVAHKHDHPLEYHLWDIVLTLWVMGWVGWVPAFALDDIWVMPALVFAMFVPSLYVRLRAAADHAHKLRCDWLPH